MGYHKTDYANGMQTTDGCLIFDYKVTNNKKYALKFAAPTTTDVDDDQKLLKQNVERNLKLNVGRIEATVWKVREIPSVPKLVMQHENNSATGGNPVAVPKSVHNTKKFWERPSLCTVLGTSQGSTNFDNSRIIVTIADSTHTCSVSYQVPLVFLRDIQDEINSTNNNNNNHNNNNMYPAPDIEEEEEELITMVVPKMIPPTPVINLVDTGNENTATVTTATGTETGRM